ncbi:MAG: hypothetical protein PWQ83_1756 [Thermosipho sp. (in: thermotogales)]|nr:hypothetical protein [Thermosipho sp. (in: thermotogales)]MDK2900255.1 hypothetical protein [Thermosipho sp. (in: thermotogales)]
MLLSSIIIKELQVSFHSDINFLKKTGFLAGFFVLFENYN